MSTFLDIRQSQTRILQDQLNLTATQGMDSTLASINSELTKPARLIAAATPSLVVTVGSGTVVNPNTSKNRVLQPINNTTPSFAGGTITFPSTSGTITVSPGTNGSITIGASQFVAVLVQLTQAGQITLVTGAAAGSLGAVVIPTGNSIELSLGYIIVQSNASSVIQSVTDAMIYQFDHPNTTLGFLQTAVTTDSATTGTDQTLPSTDIVTGITRLTNASLVSIGGITAGVSGQILVLENQTGNTVTINNNDSGTTAANRIYTGTAASVSMAANQTFQFIYDITVSRWLLTGGTGSGSGGSGSGAKNYLSAYTASTSGGVANPGNGNFELGTTSGFSLAHSVISTANGYPVPTSVATAGNAFSSSSGGSAASANLSLSVVSSSQLAGSYSGDLASSAASVAGDMLISSAFYIDLEDKAKMMTIKFYYEAVSGTFNFSGTSSNTFAVWLYDVTNGAWIMPQGVYAMTQGSGTGYATATFQTTSNSTQYQLALINVNATSGAYSLYLDDITLGPQTAPFGPAMTDWNTNYAFTPSGFGTIAASSYYSRRVGDTLEVVGWWKNGTVAASTALIQLPAGLAIDTTKLTSTANSQMVGYFIDVTNGSSQTINTQVYGQSPIFYDGSTNNQLFLCYQTGSNAFTKLNGSALVNNSDTISFWFKIPIAGWSSNTSMSSDTDTRVVAASMTSTGGQTIANVTNATIQYNTVNFDTHGAFNTSTFTYTVPVSGYYEVFATFFLTGTTGGGAETQTKIVQNGTNVFFNIVTQVTGAANSQGFGTTLLKCNVGDTLLIQCFQNGGSTMTVATTSTNEHVFFIRRLSGPAVVTATETVAAHYQSTASTSWTSSGNVLIYGTKLFDSHSAYNTSTGVYTAPVSGKYRVTSSNVLTGAAGSAGSAFLHLDLLHNGGGYESIGWYSFSSASATNVQVAGSTTIQLLAGDTIQLDTGESGVSGGTSNGSAGQNFFTIERIGN